MADLPASSTYSGALSYHYPQAGLIRRSLPNMAHSILVHEPAKIYPYHLLLITNYRLPADVDRCNLEVNLIFPFTQSNKKEKLFNVNLSYISSVIYRMLNLKLCCSVFVLISIDYRNGVEMKLSDAPGYFKLVLCANRMKWERNIVVIAIKLTSTNKRNTTTTT